MEYPATRKKHTANGSEGKALFNKTVKLAEKLTMEELKRLKEIIEARIQAA